MKEVLTEDKAAQSDESKHVVAAIDLVDLIAKTELRYFEVAARRADGFPCTEGVAGKVGEEDESPAFRVLGNVDSEFIIVRLRFNIDINAARLVADIGARFVWSEPLVYGDGVVQQFIERVGVPYVYPYVRVAVDELVDKVGLAASPLPLLRMDSVRVAEIDQPES